MKKDLLILGFVILIIAFLASGTDIQSVDEFYLTQIDEITEDSETVSLTVRCDTVLDNWDKLTPALRSDEYVPADGVILPLTDYALREGDTAFDILDRAMRSGSIHLDYQGASETIFGSVYIKGINHLYEYACGDLSGWMFLVGGKDPGYGCSKYVLEDGDVIAFLYTCDLGRDLGASLGKAAAG